MSSADEETTHEGGALGRRLQRYKRIAWMQQQRLMDEWTPHVRARWTATTLLLGLFVVRVAHLGGFFIVAYALGIFLLNQFIAFLTPQIDPEDGDGDALPTSVALDDEFRPFVRHLPEKKFWIAATRAILVASFATFIPFLNIPVFWPILVIYFFGLLVFFFFVFVLFASHSHFVFQHCSL